MPRLSFLFVAWPARSLSQRFLLFLCFVCWVLSSFFAPSTTLWALPPPRKKPTKPASKDAQTPEDALKAQISSELQSSQPIERYRALEQLRKISEPWAEQWLLRASQDQDPRLRWLAIAILRKRTSPRVLSRLHAALKDKDERVRLNALYGLFPYQRKNATTALAISKMRQDPAPLVRAAWCDLVLKNQPQRIALIRLCLNDTDQRVRLALARAILASSASNELQQQAKILLQESKRRRSWMGRHHFFRSGTLVPGGNLRERLRRERQRVRNAYLVVQRWHKRYRDLPGKETSCLQKRLREIRRQEEKLSNTQYHILSSLSQNNLQALDKHYSLFLLARNVALRVHYQRARRCYQALHSRFAWHRRLLGQAIWFDEFPLFYDHPQIRRFEASANFLFDSFVDQLRDDFHAPYELESRLQKRLWTLGTGLETRLVHQILWGRGWLARVDARAEGRYFFLAPQLGIFGGQLDLQLLHGERKARSERLAFLRLFGEYSQAPPEDTGWPDVYAGERVRSLAALGIANRWNLSSSRSLSFKVRLDHVFQAPIKQFEDIALSAGMRSQLRARMALRFQSGFFGLALWQSFSWSHAFEARNISTNQWDVMLRLHLGDRLNVLHFELSGGLGAYWPLPRTSEPLWPSALTQPLYTPILSIGLTSPPSANRYPFHWSLRFERKMYPSLRFDASAIIEHRFVAQLSFGAPPPQLELLPWTQFVAIFGMSLHFLEVDALRLQPQGAPTPAKIPQQLIRIFAKSYLPLQRRWGIEFGLTLDFVAQGFRSYEDPDSNPLQAFPRNNFLPRVMTYLRVRFGLPLR